MANTMATRRVVCASARAFVSSSRCEGGGNPVSVFLSSAPFTSDERIKLAQTCAWESIVVENPEDEQPTFHFYMPSGEEVSFCGRKFVMMSNIVRQVHLLES